MPTLVFTGVKIFSLGEGSRQHAKQSSITAKDKCIQDRQGNLQIRIRNIGNLPNIELKRKIGT